MNKYELQERLMLFSIRVFKLVERFPKTKGSDIVSYQLLKSASSSAANYRAACRAKSKADFINKIKIVEEETDESQFWLVFTKRSGLLKENQELELLIKEATELVAIFTQTLKTLKSQ